VTNRPLGTFINARAILGLLVGLTAACGAGGSGVSYGTPTSFCREYVRRYLAGNYACFGGEGEAPKPESMTDYCADLDAALARGEIAYDKTAASACLAKLDHLFDVRCNGDLPCVTEVVKGQVATGAACGSFMECAVAGSACRGPERACGGDVCVEIPPFYALLGEACGETKRCDEGLRCDVGSSGVVGTCIAQAAGASCEIDGDCLLWSEYCDEEGLCRPRLPVGSACADQPWACVMLSNCDVDADKCVAAGQDGQDCGRIGICWSGTCDDEDGSETAGRCIPPRAAGDPCIDDWQCASHTCGEAEVCIDCPTGPS
jgi:hypothetical protein